MVQKYLNGVKYGDKRVFIINGKIENQLSFQIFQLVSIVLKNAMNILGVSLPKKIFDDLKFNYSAQYDDKDAIGRRYRRQDAIGTPFCITIDYTSLDDNSVTLRDRDQMKQERIPLASLENILDEKLNVRNWLKTN